MSHSLTFTVRLQQHPGELHHRVSLEFGDRDGVVQLVQHLLRRQSKAAYRGLCFQLRLVVNPLPHHDRVDLVQRAVHREVRIAQHRIRQVQTGQLQVRIVPRQLVLVAHKRPERVKQLVHVDQVALQQLPLVEPRQNLVVLLVVRVVSPQIFTRKPAVNLQQLLQHYIPHRVAILLLLVLHAV
uniref:(northern house mosquito) hypothetical protein n=1 Tax=Culex pipiens TaxID=7175 RepID=A0A8D8CEH1_CULPI